MSDKVLLQDILEFTRDGEWGKEDPFENSRHTRVIRGTDFEDIRIGKVNELPHRHVAERFVEYKELKPFDVLLETAGGSKNTPTGRTLLLKPSLFEKVDVPIVCASFARFLRFDDSKVEPEYLFWHLQYLYRNGVLKQYHVQHTGVARFQFTTFKENEYLELPDRETQRNIASTLSSFDDLIENNTRRIEILEEMARRIYREWFVHFRYPGHEDDELVDSGTELGEIPEGWEVKKLKNFLKFKNGKSPETKEGVEYPVYGSNGIIGKCNEPGWEDGIIIGRVGAYCGSVEYCEGKFWGSDNTIVATTREEYDFSLFAYYKLEDLNLRRYAGGSAQPLMTQTVIKDIKIAIPHSDLLEQFSEQARELWKFKRNLEKKNKKLKGTRDLLLPKLISGKIDVEELNIN